MNKGRIVLGGVLAGVILFGGDILVHGMILGARWQAQMEAGHVLDPGSMGMVLHILMPLVVGVCMAFLYALARPRLGPGPRTAMLVGLVSWVLIYLEWTGNAFLFQPGGRFIPFVQVVGGLVATQLAAFVAGLLYKEGAAAPASPAKAA